MNDIEKHAVAQIQSGILTLTALGHRRVAGYSVGDYDTRSVEVTTERPAGAGTAIYEVLKVGDDDD